MDYQFWPKIFATHNAQLSKVSVSSAPQTLPSFGRIQFGAQLPLGVAGVLPDGSYVTTEGDIFYPRSERPGPWSDFDRNMASWGSFVAHMPSIEGLGLKKPEHPENLILISDPNRDPDDLVTIIIASVLKKRGFMNLDSIVTTLGDEEIRILRSSFAGALVDRLGLGAKLAIGGEYLGSFQDGHKRFLPTSLLKSTGVQHNFDGAFLETRLKNAPDHSLTILAIAAMPDPARLIQDNPELFKNKVKHVAIMGGVLTDDKGLPIYDRDGYIQPDERAYNNIAEQHAANVFYRAVQESGIPLTVLSKEAAYKGAVKPDFYEGLAKTGNVIGEFSKDIQYNALKGLWEEIHHDPNAKLTPAAFFKIFTDLNPEDDATKIAELTDQGFEKVWAHVTKLNLYDPLTLLACLPTLRDEVYSPKRISQPDKSPVTLIGAEEITHPERLKTILSVLGEDALHYS